MILRTHKVYFSAQNVHFTSFWFCASKQIKNFCYPLQVKSAFNKGKPKDIKNRCPIEPVQDPPIRGVLASAHIPLQSLLNGNQTVTAVCDFGPLPVHSEKTQKASFFSCCILCKFIIDTMRYTATAIETCDLIISEKRKWLAGKEKKVEQRGTSGPLMRIASPTKGYTSSAWNLKIFKNHCC